MDQDKTHRIELVLASLAPAGDAATIADAVAQKFTAVDAVLSPILGVRGFAALYGRSLHVVALRYPWLSAAAADEPRPALNVQPLRAALSQQTGADAAACGALLLQTVYELLVSLVGASLTERLLRSEWAPFIGAPGAQDNLS